MILVLVSKETVAKGRELLPLTLCGSERPLWCSSIAYDLRTRKSQGEFTTWCYAIARRAHSTSIAGMVKMAAGPILIR